MSEALSRLGALGSVDAGMPWSVAEVALADLIGRFRHDTGAAEVGAARVFTGLVADHVWVLDTDVPAQGARPRALNEWRVADRLAPDLEQVLRSRPELIGEMARGLAARSFAPGRPRTSSRRSACWRLLPDFLGLEEGGEIELLGQEESAPGDLARVSPASRNPTPTPPSHTGLTAWCCPKTGQVIRPIGALALPDRKSVV